MCTLLSGLSNWGTAYVQMGRLKQQVDFDGAGADALFKRAVILEPENPESVTIAAGSAALLGHFDEALTLARRGVDLDPLNAESWQNLAEVEFLAGQLDKAAIDVKKALELSSEICSSHIC